MEVQGKATTLLGKVSFENTHSFSSAFLNYIKGKADLRPFYHKPPSMESFKDQIGERSFPNETRQVLHQTLISQYEGLEVSETLQTNLENLKSDRTFTITTGHQLNLFTGPLYFIYKIITTIRTCQELRSAYPSYNFVPVYWMASEDHDFEEINHFWYGQQKYTWETDQKGAVGRFDPQSIHTVLKQIPGLPAFFHEAYLKHKTLADAVRYYVNYLFGEKGLVVMDADNIHLKKILQPVMMDDIFKNTPYQLVNGTNQSLEAMGYKAQVHPREINFFYLDGDIRCRVVREGKGFRVLDTDLQFPEEELRALVQTNPEKFSPNVVIRPLYQELTLPNLAYVGGPSELIYWLQLKGVFDHFDTNFPILLPRNFCMVVDANTRRKMEQTGVSLTDLFLPENELVNDRIKTQAEYPLELTKALKSLQGIFDEIMEQSSKVDPTLGQLVTAEKVRSEKRIQKIEKKLLKAEKRNQETTVKRIGSIKKQLFPGGSLQERKDNFLNYYLEDPYFIQACLASCDPLDFRFHLFSHG